MLGKSWRNVCFTTVFVRASTRWKRRSDKSDFIRLTNWPAHGRIDERGLAHQETCCTRGKATPPTVGKRAAAGPTPAWLLADHDGLKGTVNRLPDRNDIAAPIEERLIVEHYSR